MMLVLKLGSYTNESFFSFYNCIGLDIILNFEFLCEILYEPSESNTLIGEVGKKRTLLWKIIVQRWTLVLNYQLLVVNLSRCGTQVYWPGIFFCSC